MLFVFSPFSIFMIIAVFIILVFIWKALYIVPQKEAYIIERLGKFHRTLLAGFHIVLPIIEKVAHRHNLKERAIEVPGQICITRDNIAVEVDAVLYMQVIDPEKASYGILDYLFATTQLAQTTVRSAIGKLDLDQTFRERDNINAQLVQEIEKAADPWGIKANRYEIKDIKPPKTIYDAMEKQMRAEREKRASIAQSEGDRQAQINRSEGERQLLIAISEGEKQKRMNEAEGKAFEILNISKAIAEGLREVGKAIGEKGGKEAMTLRVAEQYVKEFGNIAKESNTMIIPANLSELSSMVATATSIFQNQKAKEKENTIPEKN